MLNNIFVFEEKEKPGRTWLIFLALILILGASLRFRNLDKACVWVDEANAYLIAKAPLSQIPSRLGDDSSPPVYYFLLNLWIKIFENNASGLRSLSIGFSLILLLLVFFVTKHYFGQRAGILSALVFALSPAQIFYSQQIRMYTLIALLGLLSTFILLLALKRLRTAHLIGYALSMALCLLTHNIALYILGFHGLLILLSGSFRKKIKAWVCVYLGVLLIYAPWIPIFWRQLTSSDTYPWFEKIWESWSFFTPIFATVSAFSPSGHYLAYSGFHHRDWWGIDNLFYLALFLIGSFGTYKKTASHPLSHRLWAPLFVLSLMAQAITLSHLMAPHYVPGRVDQAFYPAYAIMVGLGLSLFRWRSLRILGVCAVLLFGIYSFERYHPGPDPVQYLGDDRDLARFLNQEMTEDDVVLCTSLSRAPLEFYMEAPFMFSFPGETSKHMGGQDDAALLKEETWLCQEADRVLDRIQGSIKPGARIFLVYVKTRVNQCLLQRVQKRCQVKKWGIYRQQGTALDMELMELVTQGF